MKIIKNGNVVLTAEVARLDIAIKDGKILSIANEISASEHDEVIDATGCFVMAGAIDGHTHLDMDNGITVTADNFESGTKAAVAGGTTMIIDFATQEKGGTLKDAFLQWSNKAGNNSYSNYGFHMAIADWNDDVRKELPDMFEQGICSFKIYYAYDSLRVRDYDCMDILSEMKKHGGLLGVHCENGDILNYLIKQNLDNGNTSPKFHAKSHTPEIEAEAISRLLYMSKVIGHPVQIVHLSSELGMREVRKHRKLGQKVYVESCPQYLLLDDSNYEKTDFEGAKYVMSPPLRSESDIKALEDAIASGEIDTIATDHCSYNYKGQKEFGINDFSKIPNGSPGIEHRVVLMYTKFVESGKISIVQLSRLLSENAAKQYGMSRSKGVIKTGYDADILILQTGVRDIISAKTQLQNVDYTPYEGMEVTARVHTVLVNGEVAYENGKVIGKKYGKFIKRERI